MNVRVGMTEDCESWSIVHVACGVPCGRMAGVRASGGRAVR